MNSYESLLTRVREKKAKVGIVGLGYVGIPLARAFIDGGYQVLGFDIDQRKIDRLLAGESYIGHISSEWIGDCVRRERFVPTADMKRLAEADAILICVPTPLSESRDPDLSYIEGTARFIAAALRPGQLVVLESTTYPGTTRDVVLPILAAGGLKAGEDFFLAYSPEREDPGNPQFAAGNIPKVVGGLEPKSLELANLLYGAVVVKTVPVSSCEVAEATKILENTYRAVNIALVNELKLLMQRMNIDVWEIIDAAKTKPFGFQAFYPGPGLGGHCLPIDPFYLSWVARKHGMQTRFIELAGEINTSMPTRVVERTALALNDRGKPVKGSKICILGVAYKKDVDDPRESPAFELMEMLAERGAQLSYSDPHVANLPKMRHHDVPALQSEALTPEFLKSLDAALIVTDHTGFDYASIVKHAPLVIDTRNATRRANADGKNVVHA
jgi:UDP-N-acetyl-D-glucosamine dehydrogenase